MGILKGRRGPALPALAAGTLVTLGLALLAAPAAAQNDSRFTHGECLASDTLGPVDVSKRRTCNPADWNDDDRRYFGFNPLRVYVAPSSRWEQGGGRGPNLFSMTLSVHCKESVAIGWRTRDATATAGQDYTAVNSATHVFAPGSNGAQCGVDTMDDETPEPDETFMVESFQLTDPNICDGTTLCATGDPEPAHLCVLDNDPGGGQPNPLCDFGQRQGESSNGSPRVTVEPMALTVTEGDTVGDTYTVFLRTQPTGNVTVTVGGHSGTDVRVDKSSLTFTTGNFDQPQTVKVTAVHDNDADDDEVRLTHTANGGGYNNVGADEVVVTVVDDDLESTGIELSISSQEVREEGGAQSLTVTAELDGVARGQETTVTLTVEDDTATSPEDYAAPTPVTLTIGAQATRGTATVTVTPEDNSMDEPNKTLTIEASTSSGLRLSPSSFTITILDDDGPPTGIDLTVQPSQFSESAGSQGVEVTATFTGGAALTSPTTVALSVVERTARVDDDYTVSGVTTLTIPANSRSGAATFTLTVVDDADAEPAETLEVQGIDQTSSPALPVDPAAITIAASDGGGGGGGGGGGTTTRSGLELRPQNARASEDSGQMVFTVEISDVSSSPVSVRWKTADGTAESGDDYVAERGTLTIPARERSGTIRVRLLDDRIHEPRETFAIRFSAPEGATLGNDEAIGTIFDDDSVPGLAVEDASAEEGAREILFTAELSNGSASPVSVEWETVDGTAESGDDYATATGTLTIAAGDQSATIRVEIEDDRLHEPEETFAIRFSAPEGATLADDEAVGTIVDDDPVPELAVEDASAEEGAREILFTAELSNGSASPVSVDWETADGTAKSTTDYAEAARTLIIPAGQTSGTIAIRVDDDSLHEPDETFAIRFSAPSGVTLRDDEAIGTIVDDDSVPELAVEDASAEEGAREILFTANLSNGSGTPVSVEWETVDGTAESGDDYTGATGTLTVAAGAQSATVSIEVQDDRLHERDETFAIRFSAPSGVTLGDDEAIGTILDDDPVPELRVRDANASENAREVVFAAKLSAPSALPVTVRWRTSDDGASAGADYTASEGVLSIPAGRRDARVAVPLLDDRLDEPDETFTVELSEPTGVTLANTRAVGTILDDDAEPALLIGDATAVEGEGRLGFFVWLASDSGRTVTVDYATREGSATAEADYRPATGTLDIPPGSEGETIWVAVVDDRLHENPETLELVLADPEFAVPGDLVATGTIKDDDAEPGLRIADVSASERAGGMVFVATMEAVAGRTLSWDFQTWDGSAVAGEDYERRTGTLMFEAGEIRKTIPVTIVDDTMDEVEEDFRVILRNPRDSALPVPEPTGLILDDDDNAVVADAWASRFGRTVATQVVNAVAGRFAGMGGPGSHFLFGMDPFSTFGLAGARGNQRWENQWRETSSGGSESVRLGLDPGRILSGTSFVYQTEEDEPSDGGLDGRWTAWGRGSFLQFDGLDPGVGVSGEVFNITTGFDYETGPLIAGLALAGSVGTGDYHVARTGIQSERMGEIWSLLGSAHPYVHVSLAEWLRVWGLGGIGSGTLRISGSEQDADLGMRMWAFGGRSDLRVPGLGGLRFALKSDMFWVEMDSDATDTRRGSTAEARRLRLMLESSFRVISFWGGEFSPLLEAGIRDDAGDAETGRGLEVASGFRFQNRDRGFFVEATARTLVSHEDETYREWGVGGTLRLDPGPDYLGLAIQINSSQGAAASSVQRMWSDPGAVTYFPGMAQGRHEAEVGYGFRALRGGAMVIPFSGFAYSPSGANSFRVGSRVRLGSRWMLSLQADRNRYGFRDPWYGVVLRGHLLPER